MICLLAIQDSLWFYSLGSVLMLTLLGRIVLLDIEYLLIGLFFFFPFSTLNISFFMVSDEKSAIDLLIFIYLFLYIVNISTSLASVLNYVQLLMTPWPGFSDHGIFQRRILEWVAISYSKGSFLPRDQSHISVSPALAGGFFTTGATWEAQYINFWFAV